MDRILLLIGGKALIDGKLLGFAVLKGISDGLSRGKKHDEMEKLIKGLWKANMRHPQASEAINKDIISHFVLRLVYCRT